MNLKTGVFSEITAEGVFIYIGVFQDKPFEASRGKKEDPELPELNTAFPSGETPTQKGRWIIMKRLRLNATAISWVCGGPLFLFWIQTLPLYSVTQNRFTNTCRRSGEKEPANGNEFCVTR
jgi:hypothetical protein